jgi:hypothetical protein
LCRRLFDAKQHPEDAKRLDKMKMTRPAAGWSLINFAFQLQRMGGRRGGAQAAGWTDRPRDGQGGRELSWGTGYLCVSVPGYRLLWARRIDFPTSSSSLLPPPPTSWTDSVSSWAPLFSVPRFTGHCLLSIQTSHMPLAVHKCSATNIGCSWPIIGRLLGSASSH